MIRKAKTKLAEWLLQVVRAYFIGKTVHHMSRLDGQPIHRAEGKVIGGVIRRDATRMPTGMELFLSTPGRSPTDLKRFPVTALERDKTLGWMFYD